MWPFISQFVTNLGDFAYLKAFHNAFSGYWNQVQPYSIAGGNRISAQFVKWLPVLSSTGSPPGIPAYFKRGIVHESIKFLLLLFGSYIFLDKERVFLSYNSTKVSPASNWQLFRKCQLSKS